MIKRGQAWGFDAMIAFSIFAIGLVTLYLFMLNYQGTRQSSDAEIAQDAQLIAETLMSEGTPPGWDVLTVSSPGLLSDGTINETKLQYFNTLATISYNQSKQLFPTRFNYFINFSSTLAINGTLIDGIGLAPSNSKNVARVSRYTSYQNETLTMFVIVWENR